MPKCKSCGAEIRWVEMRASGRRMPLDGEATERGEIYVCPIDGKGELGDEQRKNDVLRLYGETPFFVSHFRTCPYADLHSRG